MQTNKYGRSFKWGKALSDDFKNLILDELKKCYGGDQDTVHTVKLLKSLKLV